MEEIMLDVQVRDEIGSRRIKRIRRENFLPAVVYGSKQKPTLIKVDRRAYERIRRAHQGERIIFRLNVLDGQKKLKDYSVIVKEEQQHPVNEEVLHIDFNRISLKEKIEIKVALHAKGVPVGVAKDGGSLDHVLWELDIICLPTQIPHHIDVEVGHLEIGDSVHVKNIVLPEGITTKHDPQAIVFTVSPPMQEVKPEEAVVTEPEVIKEKAKVKEEGGEQPAKEAAKKAPEEKAATKPEKKPEK